MEPYSKTSRYSLLCRVTTRNYANDPYFGAIYDNKTESQQGTFTQSNTFSGYKLPNWRDLVRQGQGATTPASGVMYFGQGQYYYAHAKFRRISPPAGAGGYWGTEAFGIPNYTSVFSGDPTPNASVVAEAENLCIRKFLDRAREAQASLRGESVAEVTKTIKGILNPFQGIRKLTVDYLSDLRKVKRRVKDRRARRKILSDSYLEWTFGITPLANDVGSLLANAAMQHPALQVISANGSVPFAASTFGWNPFPGGAFLTSLGQIRSVSNYTMRIKGAVRTGAVLGNLPQYQNLGLQVSEILPTAWAVIPYSFVVDYFLNVGSVIDALTFRYQDLSWGNVTRRRTVDYDFSLGTLTPNHSPSISKIESMYEHGGAAKFKKVTFSRSALLPSDLLPTLRFNVPLREKPWVNIAAILTSNLRGLHPFF